MQLDLLITVLTYIMALQLGIQIPLSVFLNRKSLEASVS